MIKDVRHTGVVVKDLEASLHFYHDLLGFRIVKQMEESGPFIDTILSLEHVRVTTIKMTSPNGQMIELLKYHSHTGNSKTCHINEYGITHIAFTVHDLEHAYTHLQGNGVPFVSAPQVSPDGYAKVAFCRAPEGTHVELVEVL